jgi:hypothetical protein
MPRWCVQIFGGNRTEFLGSVTAANEQKVPAEAVKIFQIPADWQTRVTVSRLNIGWLRWLRGAR